MVMWVGMVMVMVSQGSKSTRRAGETTTQKHAKLE
jgi:hypothetical protein